MSLPIGQSPNPIPFSSDKSPHKAEVKTIDDLPNDIILEVFSYLGTPHLIEISKVSTKWSELSTKALDKKGYDMQTTAYQGVIDIYSPEIRETVFGKKEVQVHINNAEQAKFYEEKIDEMNRLVNPHSQSSDYYSPFASRTTPTKTQKITNFFRNFFS